MPKSLAELENDIGAAIAPGFRARLIARGQARSMIWRDGGLPAGAPEFSPLLTYDLRTYGYALLELAFRVWEQNGNPNLVRRAFEQAAIAIEATISNGNVAERDRSFHLLIAGAAYHLGRFSARAYSLLTRIQQAQNYAPLERALAQLMLRDLAALKSFVIDFQLAGRGSDQSVAAYLNEQVEAADEDNLPTDRDGDSYVFEALDRAVTGVFFEAVTIFLLAIERGAAALVEQAIDKLRDGLAACGELNLIPQWWAHKIAIHLFRDTWDASFHKVLPLLPDAGDEANWQQLRETFISLLMCRGRAEIDLWPSQIVAAGRAMNQGDDLVVSLPTSGGKTRIAELCILRCLASGKRVVFVTPLRALSAQTEATLQSTFVPLGKTVSALYGSIGVSGIDEDAIASRDIVVATPEKLDFAIRNDPSLIDDVGLLIFDEGHMLGLGEREVRYEVQIQRLLKRADAPERRIVCLSAVLPDGEQLEDFTNWLRRDQAGGPVKSDWRPTGLNFGEVVWDGSAARLNLRIGEERPFIPRFLVGRVPPIGRRQQPFPRDLGELCLATAWRLIEERQSVLIFCPVRAHVEPFANRVVDLNERGVLPNLLEDPSVLATALALGAEWLGEGHPILKCLRIGVAIHHGALPTAYRKEVERLLRQGHLKVTISSPTLAQGLNLSATTVVMHSLHRNRERINASEFKNVIGRAGRAYIDVRGLVLYPIFDRIAQRIREWEELISDVRTREMESGLVRLVYTLVLRMHQSLGRPPIQQLMEYVLNNAAAWQFPEIPNESAETRVREFASWNTYVSSLDTAILSLVGSAEVNEEHIEETLDDILASSLWERRLARRNEEQRRALKAGLVSRAHHIWRNSTSPQRKGYFLAGVGFNTGRALDDRALNLNDLLVRANAAVLAGDEAAATETITQFAQIVFDIPPFQPEPLPDNWRAILSLWLRGLPLAEELAGQGAEALQFIEGGLVYRLPWAMEAVRVRAGANGDAIGLDQVPLEAYELGVAVAAVETGTLNRSATLLIQAGFSSRMAAIQAVMDTAAQFANGFELREWLDSPDLNALTDGGDWPTPETSGIWRAFKATFRPMETAIWNKQEFEVPATWLGQPPNPGTPVRIHDRPGETLVLSAPCDLIGSLDVALNPSRQGLIRGSVSADRTGVLVSYIGPMDLLLH
jgi:superfamily II DNA/RNA helicase